MQKKWLPTTKVSFQTLNSFQKTRWRWFLRSTALIFCRLTSNGALTGKICQVLPSQDNQHLACPAQTDLNDSKLANDQATIKSAPRHDSKSPAKKLKIKAPAVTLHNKATPQRPMKKRPTGKSTDGAFEFNWLKSDGKPNCRWCHQNQSCF